MKYSKYIINALQHQINLGLLFKVYQQHSFSLHAKMAKRYSSNDFKLDHKVNGYTLLDAKYALNFGESELYLTANNILNIKYIEAGVAPMPGTQFLLGFKYNLLY